MDSEQLRREFEAHWQSQTKSGDGTWTTLERLAAWEAYQAAYIAGLRRAAGICEQKSVTAHTSTGAARAGACELAILAEADALEKGR